jgi:hypothetical protein
MATRFRFLVLAMLAFAWFAMPQLHVSVKASGNCLCEGNTYGYGPGNAQYQYCSGGDETQVYEPDDESCASYCDSFTHTDAAGECFSQCGPGDPPATPIEYAYSGDWWNFDTDDSLPYGAGYFSC